MEMSSGVRDTAKVVLSMTQGLRHDHAERRVLAYRQADAVMRLAALMRVKPAPVATLHATYAIHLLSRDADRLYEMRLLIEAVLHPVYRVAARYELWRVMGEEEDLALLRQEMAVAVGYLADSDSAGERPMFVLALVAIAEQLYDELGDAGDLSVCSTCAARCAQDGLFDFAAEIEAKVGQLGRGEDAYVRAYEYALRIVDSDMQKRTKEMIETSLRKSINLHHVGHGVLKRIADIAVANEQKLRIHERVAQSLGGARIRGSS
jgi:hypothetical protein